MMSAPLWSGEVLVAAMGARLVGAMPAAVSGISIDTRSLEPGDAFFAITGEARNGHESSPARSRRARRSPSSTRRMRAVSRGRGRTRSCPTC